MPEKLLQQLSLVLLVGEGKLYQFVGVVLANNLCHPAPRSAAPHREFTNGIVAPAQHDSSVVKFATPSRQPCQPCQCHPPRRCWGFARISICVHSFCSDCLSSFPMLNPDWHSCPIIYSFGAVLIPKVEDISRVLAENLIDCSDRN